MEQSLSELDNKRKDVGEANALAKALQTIVSALRLKNGSLKVYVRDGKASPRVEVQADLSKVIEL